MRQIIVLLLLTMTIQGYSGQASLESGTYFDTEGLTVSAPGNGEVFMREAVVKGMAGSSILLVNVSNLTTSNKVSVKPVKGKWLVRVPLAIERVNKLLITAQLEGGRASTSSEVRVWVESKLDFSVAGRVFMGIVWALIIALNVFAFYNIFKVKKENIVEPLEIDTQDD